MTAPFRITRFPGGLKTRIAVVSTALSIGVAAAGAALFTKVTTSELTSQFEDTMGSLATNFARNSAHGVFIESGDALHELVDHLRAEPDVVTVEVRNAKDVPILVAGTGETTGQVAADVIYDDAPSAALAPFVIARPHEPKKVGTVRVGYRRTHLEARLRRVKLEIWGAALLLAIFGGAVSLFLADRTVAPLVGLGRATGRVADGDLETKVLEQGDREVAALAHSFNQMTDALRTSREKLENSYAELARKERLATMGQFTAVIAHELKNPLGVILSSAQVIANPRRTPEMKDRAAQFIIEEVRRLSSDLTGFLAFARPKPPELKPTDVGACARRAVEAWKQSTAPANERTPAPMPVAEIMRPPAGIAAEAIVAPDTPMALADADQLHQVLLNLLLNASQAMQQAKGDGATGRIEVRVEPRNGAKVALIVADDGPGMPADVQAHAFEPFFTTKKRGSGLGLAVVDQIAKAHGGGVELWSEVGKGTRFTILLQRAD